MTDEQKLKRKLIVIKICKIENCNNPVRAKQLCVNHWQKEYRQQNKNKVTKVYEKTINGFLMRTYRNMLSRVKGIQSKKIHLYENLQILDKEIFYKWSKKDNDFNLLFNEWEKSNYKQKLTPSIDRIDSSKGYTLDNMRWLTHSENSKLGSESRWQSKE